MKILIQSKVEEAVSDLLADLGDELKLAKRRMRTKVLDPLNVLLDFQSFGEDLKWEDRLAIDQMYRNRSMKLGYFHQRLLALHPDWEELPIAKGNPDLVNHRRKLIIELKARRNTVKASDLYQTYDNLLEWTNRGYEGYTAAFTYILPSKKVHLTQPIHFTPTVAKSKTKKPPDNRVLEMDGLVLWAVTVSSQPGIPMAPYDQPNALFQVYEQVAEAMMKISKGGLSDVSKSTVMQIAKESFHA